MTSSLSKAFSNHAYTLFTPPASLTAADRREEDAAGLSRERRLAPHSSRHLRSPPSSATPSAVSAERRTARLRSGTEAWSPPRNP
uniref:Uncharacterized protein n=1 Tax=Arundo donax TaxID=35708 RepID=A0A0A8YXX7_ARUDO